MNPIKSTIKTEIIPLLSIFTTVILSFYFYSKFPEQVPTHWNIKGEVDGYSSRMFAAFGLPAIILGIYLLFNVFPYIDPKKERYEQFKKIYHIFKNMFVVFFSLIYILTALNALGYNLPIGTWIPIFVGVLFVIIGNYMSKIKINWFMGVRTPWTLSSEENWNKTHRFSAKVFILSGLLFVLIPFVPEKLKIILMIVALSLMVVATMGYSFILYLKENKTDEKNNKS